MKNDATWLNALLSGNQGIAVNDLSVWSFLLVVAMSLASGIFSSYLYTRLYSGRATGSEVHRAFPLLSVSITTIFLCIQFSLPLSLGLLGALSIVRFRTPIKEPEEVGFIMFVIAQALACATYNFVFLGILLFFAVLGMLLLKYVPVLRHRLASGGVVMLRLPEKDFGKASEEILKTLQHDFRRAALDSLSHVNGQAVATYSFSSQREENIGNTQKALTEIAPDVKLDVYFMRPRSL